VLDAKERSRRDTTEVKNAGREMSQDKQQLAYAQEIVAEAHRVIAQGEARLRQLGAKPLSKKSSFSPKQRQTKK
tara:strand:+ start:3015 stop:3236 length:222 start_codon:yes stop_codon:yes gene_type:complete